MARSKPETKPANEKPEKVTNDFLQHLQARDNEHARRIVDLQKRCETLEVSALIDMVTIATLLWFCFTMARRIYRLEEKCL